MTPTPDPQIDPVSVFVALLGVIVSAELAKYIAPYIVIGAAGLVGSAFALSRAEPVAGLRWIGYVAWYTTMSLLLTAPMAYGVNAWTGLDVRWLLGPVSGLIAAIGHDWPRLGQWVVERLGRVIERKAGASE